VRQVAGEYTSIRASDRQEAGAMDDVVELPLEGGGTVLVRVAEPAAGHDAAAEALLLTMTRLSRVPDEINVEFAIEMSAQAGAVIATLGSTANFKVSLTWRASDADRATAP
jgi:hypothetical protein